MDRRVLHFGPWGLGGELPPEVSAKLLDEQMAHLTLPETVPASVQSQFEKVKDLYRAGLFQYDNFQTAARDAHRVIEVALKVCFVNHYSSGLPLVVSTERVVEAITSWSDVVPLLRRRPGIRPRLAGHRSFNGSLMSLMRWARAERYLYGQRNRRRERLTVDMRNELFHTERDIVEMPPNAYRRLRGVWEIICRLSATDPVDGIDYPIPAERIPMIFGRGPDESEAVAFGLGALGVDHDPRDEGRTWYVILAYPHEDRIFDWQDGFELTHTPITRLWGPGSWSEVRAVINDRGSFWTGDTVTTLDRIFYSRIFDGRAELPRTAAQVKELRHYSSDERWIVVQADDPLDAWVHARNVADNVCSNKCGCPVTVLRDRVTRRRVDAFMWSGVRAIPGPRTMVGS